MQKTRRAARELALNILYQTDVAGMPVEEAIDAARENAGLQGEAEIYALKVIYGVLDNIKHVDEIIRALAPDWPPERQPSVDRNVLRIAIYEMAYEHEVPDVVSVNEAVELAKRFSTPDSGKFVNGVLAGYLKSKTEIMEERGIGSTDS